MTTLAPLLVAARGQRTATSLCAVAGCSRRSLWLYETGRKVPTLASLLPLVDALGLPTAARAKIMEAHMADTRAAVSA